jgi:hypothetical protein
MRRAKDFRWTSPVLTSGQILPDGKLVVDSDSDFLWMGYKVWVNVPQPSLLYRLMDSDGRFIQNRHMDLANDYSGAQIASAPENGWGSLTRVLNPFRRIPAGGFIAIELTEYTSSVTTPLLVRFTFLGQKEYKLG